MTSTLPDFLPTRRELMAQLDRLSMPADAKVLMGKLLDTTADVAGRIVEIGRQIIAFIADMVKRFPNTTLGLIVGVVVTVVVGSIPVLGAVLGPLVAPLLLAFTVTSGALNDMKNSTLAKQADLLTAKLDAALASA